MSKKSFKESKEQLYSLAHLAIKKIYENKYLNQQIFQHQNQISSIKTFFIKCSSLEGDKKMKIKLIFDEIKKIHDLLESSNKILKEEKNKLSKKINGYIDEIISEDSLEKQNLKQTQKDNLILESMLKEKDSQILKISNKLKISKKLFHYYDKKERKINQNIALYYLYNNLDILSKDLNKELVYFNYFKNKCTKNNNKKKVLSIKIQLFKDILKKFEEIAKKKDISKIYSEDEQNSIIEEYLDLNNQKNSNIKSKTKINILTVSQLFDINNDEGKEEEIIDEELHSDDEVIFEQKIKQQNKITNNDNIKKIKAQIPRVDLSQIEFNKKKVINEADLYSLANRKFQAQNIDGKINEMKIKNKEIIQKLKNNTKKLKAIKNFVIDTKKNYQLLKPLKIKSSLIDFEGNNDFNNNEKGGEFNEIEEIKEEENEFDNEENDDNLVEDNYLNNDTIEYTQTSISNRKKNKINNKKKINNYSIKKKVKITQNIKIKRKAKRAKSK